MSSEERVVGAATAGALLLWITYNSVATSAKAPVPKVTPKQQPWRRPPALHTYTLVIGAVCDEKRHDYRYRLRRLYAPYVASGAILARFVVSSERERDLKWRRKEMAANGSTGDAVDDLLFVPAAGLATMLEMADCPGHAAGTRRCFSGRTPFREAHCAHKSMGWWRAAGQWPARWYGKTDDDAVIDLPPLMHLLNGVLADISGPVFGGIVRYSSINTTNLEGACFSSGGRLAMRYRSRYCKQPEIRGPYPYVEGPLEILSPEVQQHLAPRAVADPRQRCHYEDLYVGIHIAAHPQISLVNLERLLGRKDIYEPRHTEYIGPDALLVHWVRSEAAFGQVERTFERKRKNAELAAEGRLSCAPWISSFPPLADFPCCHNWTVCEPNTPLLRQRAPIYIGETPEAAR